MKLSEWVNNPDMSPEALQGVSEALSSRYVSSTVLKEDLVSEGLVAAYEYISVEDEPTGAGVTQAMRGAMRAYVITSKGVTIPASRSKKSEEFVEDRPLSIATADRRVPLEDCDLVSEDNDNLLGLEGKFIDRMKTALHPTEYQFLLDWFGYDLTQEEVSYKYGMTRTSARRYCDELLQYVRGMIK